MEILTFALWLLITMTVMAAMVGWKIGRLINDSAKNARHTARENARRRTLGDGE